MGGDSYSRMVSVLKVALPLIALAILSTLFLVSSRTEPGQDIPFAEREIEDRVRSQQVTGPFFAGVTGAGDEITLTAEQLRTGNTRETEARDVSARLDFAGGGSIALVSRAGQVDLEKGEVVLSGDILIESSTGFRMYTDTLISRLSELDVRSPDRVRAIGPAGNLDAGGMEISTPEGSKTTQVLFTGGVKLIYDPKDPDQK